MNPIKKQLAALEEKDQKKTEKPPTIQAGVINTQHKCPSTNGATTPTAIPTTNSRTQQYPTWILGQRRDGRKRRRVIRLGRGKDYSQSNEQC